MQQKNELTVESRLCWLCNTGRKIALVDKQVYRVGILAVDDQSSLFLRIEDFEVMNPENREAQSHFSINEKLKNIVNQMVVGEFIESFGVESMSVESK